MSRLQIMLAIQRARSAGYAHFAAALERLLMEAAR